MRSAVFKVGRQELQARDGILLVGLAWTLLPVVACVPLLSTFTGGAADFVHRRLL
jgi:trk system potassium uptake protein